MVNRHTEMKFTNEGVSVTLYEGMTVADEYWKTWDEVEDIKSEEHIAILR